MEHCSSIGLLSSIVRVKPVVKEKWEISGTTKIYGLVGDPLDEARSPVMMNNFFVRQQLDAVCVPMNVPLGGLSKFVAGIRTLKNLAGLLVTMPHKTEMVDFIDHLHPTSAHVGSVSVVRFDQSGWTGATFDGVGCVQAMAENAIDPRHKNVLLLGSGGAGQSIAFAVAEGGARSIHLSDVDQDKVRKLAAALKSANPDCDAGYGPANVRDFDIVINATPLGMQDSDPFPIDPAYLRPEISVVDIVLHPTETRLCRAARAAGCRVQDGSAMHRGQAIHAYRFLGFDYDPDVQLNSERQGF
jgi:shikimate dehydrogenase